jgi:methanogen homoaconitase large subunit
MSLTTQIIERNIGAPVTPDDIVEPAPDMLMLTDGTSLLSSQNFKKLDSELVDQERIAIIYDHYCPSHKVQNADFHNLVREFVKEYRIENFYDCGVGIAHQVLPEEGLVKPGMFICGGDSHTTTQGAFGAFSVGMGATDMSISMASGKTWIKVPWTIRVRMDGAVPDHIFGKDAVLAIIKQIGLAGATYKSVEFCGTAVESFSLSSRMTMCNMAVEMGAKNGIIYPDEKVTAFTGVSCDLIRDDGKAYEKTVEVAVPSEPQVACGTSVDDVKDISSVAGVKVDQVLIGSCTNGRFEDLRSAAEVLKGKEVAVRTYVFPASKKTYLKALDSGVMHTLVEAGCMVQGPSCGPCIGIHQGVLGEEEVCFSTTNRNFRGRMGPPSSTVYLGSAASAAATALNGEIRSPVGLCEFSRDEDGGI